MWLSLVILVALCAVGKPEENTTQGPAKEEKIIVARGKLMVSIFIENVCAYVMLQNDV